jgi:Arsenate reductase and related proteins, glutaredoxin family
LTDDDLVQFMVDNPILIERPIVYDDNRAIIGRPPENVLIFSKMNKKR